MLNYNTPLTAEESAFAAEHHHLLLSYLKKARLDFDEFYDIAVFGYLRAVRKYLARPELRAYQFSTIAFRAMSCDVHHSREYWLRGKRCGRIVQTLNDDQNADDLRDSVAESVDNVIQFEEYTSTLTPLQQRSRSSATLATLTGKSPPSAVSPIKWSLWKWRAPKEASWKSILGMPPVRLEENLLCRIWVIAALKTHAVICSTVWMPYASISR